MNRFRLSMLLLGCIIAAVPQLYGEENANSFQAITYNIRYANQNDGADLWEHRAETVAKYLSKADIAGLQEVTPEQLDFLREKLADDFDSYGVGRDDGKRDGEHAAIFYRKDRFEVVEQSTFWLSETPDKAGSKGWDAKLPRTVTWMIMRDKKTDVTFVVANTHFDHMGEEARAESGKLIRQKLKDVEKDTPVLVMGDFNCLPDSLPYMNLTTEEIKGTPLQDARTVTEKRIDSLNSTWNGFKKITPDQIIDHIFVRGPIRILEFQIEDPKTPTGRFASDHLPVRLLVDLKRE